MNGSDLLDEIARRIGSEEGASQVNVKHLAQELELTVPTLNYYKGRNLNARQAMNLMERYTKRAERRLVDGMVEPIVEFFPLAPVKPKQKNGSGNWQLFSTKDERGRNHPYREGLQKRLNEAHGIYIFHDGRGQALYAGKAEKQTLWNEMRQAFNKRRDDVQSTYRVRHPTNRVEYRPPKELKRQIKRKTVLLREMATFVSAYEVRAELIGKFEALIVRAFANDLLNVKMENF